MKKIILRILIICAALIVAIMITAIGINIYIKSYVSDRIITAEQAEEMDDVDCILVLGCGINADGTPKTMLRDRLDTGIELYNLGIAPKLIMSGDHGREIYDEVNAMKTYAKDADVPSEDIFMDHAGFSTYESMYRASAIFQAKRIVIVTQEYHLYRAVYDALKSGIDAYGVAADKSEYNEGLLRESREFLARVKDFAYGIFRPEPTYLGDAIPVSGDGDVTNDKE